MRITSCRFERSVFRPEEAPRAPGPDLVFLGRSNVGKSSLINQLLGERHLARVSKTPGGTRSVNFYRVNERFHLVDLPGYGYARAPQEVRRSWRQMAEAILEGRRERIALAVLLVDARRGVTELDRTMADWLESKEVPYVIAATKADRLSASERRRAERDLREGPATGAREVVWVSARTGDGIPSLWRHLDRALAATAAGC